MTMPALPSVRMTGTDLLEYAFCPRFIYYENFLEIPEHQERRYKVLRGREIHEEKQRLNRDYLRRKIGCTGRKIGLRLHAADGLYSGEIDEILFLDDGSAAPLDYKWAEWKGRIFDTHRLQLPERRPRFSPSFQDNKDRNSAQIWGSLSPLMVFP